MQRFFYDTEFLHDAKLHDFSRQVLLFADITRVDRNALGLQLTVGSTWMHFEGTEKCCRYFPTRVFPLASLAARVRVQEAN